jgi:hypothetical protein
VPFDIQSLVPSKPLPKSPDELWAEFQKEVVKDLSPAIVRFIRLSFYMGIFSYTPELMKATKFSTQVFSDFLLETHSHIERVLKDPTGGA